MPELPSDLDEFIQRAIDEDLGSGDVTTESVVPEDARARGVFVAKADGVIAGLPVARQVFDWFDDVDWTAEVTDGAWVGAGTTLTRLGGNARVILSAERVALNFLTHLSGVATLTREYVDACAGTQSVILCTRKTLPGLRALERYAVELGGGMLHRAGLYDAVLIKDNHIAIAGSVGMAIERARDANLEIEVEVETIEQLAEALVAGADRILLDNPDADLVKRAVEMTDDRVPLEVSGGMTVEKVREIAALGPLLISVGRITHSAPALDISLDVQPGGSGG
jgi:nicotinate-nucleotide pyrophosphorylase (carboxylating)